MFDERNRKQAAGSVVDEGPVLNDRDYFVSNDIFKFGDLGFEKELYPTDSPALYAEISDFEADEQLLGISFNEPVDKLQDLHPNGSPQFDMSPNSHEIVVQAVSEELQSQKPTPSSSWQPASIKAHKKHVFKPKPKKKPRGKESRRKSKKVHKSETKNIPKNYGKQIIRFIQTQHERVGKVLQTLEIDYDAFVDSLSACKQNLSKIVDLQYLWTDFEYSKAFRIISNHFLRRKCLHWIFNSRIQEIHYPVKYRSRMLEGVKNPQQFFYLKEY